MELQTKARVVKTSTQLLALAAFIAGIAGIGPAVANRWFFIAAAIAAGGGLWALIGGSKMREAKVRIDAQGISINGELRVPRAEIKQAHYAPSGPSGAVVNVSSKVSTSIAVRDAAEAEAILRELRTDVETRTAEFAAVATSILPVLGCIALGLGLMLLGAVLHFIPLLALGPLIAVGSPFVFVSASVRVGMDGVTHRSRTGMKHYSIERIAKVTATRRGIMLHFHDGTSTQLPLAAGTLKPYERQDQAALIARIESVLAKAPTKQDGAVGWRLDRGEQPLAEWLASFHTNESFRDAAIREEDLHAVLEKAPAKERVAAAMLLAKRGGNEERIRVAAEVVAAPKLRVALETIAKGENDVERLEEVMREAEEEELQQETARVS